MEYYFYMCIILYRGHRWAGCSWVTCLQAGYRAQAELHLRAAPLPPQPQPQPILSSPNQPQPNLYLAVPVPAPQPAAKAPALCRWTRPLSLAFPVHMEAPVPYDAGPQLHTTPLCCLLLHPPAPASTVHDLQDGPELPAGQPDDLAHSLAHAASTPRTTWSGARGQEALGALPV